MLQNKHIKDWEDRSGTPKTAHCFVLLHLIRLNFYHLQHWVFRGKKLCCSRDWRGSDLTPSPAAQRYFGTSADERHETYLFTWLPTETRGLWNFLLISICLPYSSLRAFLLFLIVSTRFTSKALPLRDCKVYKFIQSFPPPQRGGHIGEALPEHSCFMWVKQQKCEFKTY